MKKPLLDVIFASEKRKEVLLLLQDEARKMNYLLTALDTTRTALLPQMKVLEEHYLVSHKRDTYELTTIGKLIVDEMKPLVDKIQIFDTDIDYWGNHKLEFIPFHLLNRMNNISQCKLVKPSVINAYCMDSDFYTTCKKSTCVYMITTFYYPNSLEIINDLIKKRINLYVIATPELRDKILEDRNSDLAKLALNEFVHVYISSKKITTQSFFVNDCYLLMSLFKDNGEYDSNYMLCSGESTIAWAKEIFNYYLKDSTPITEI